MRDLGVEQKWGKKYPIIIASWKNNWDRLSTYFDYTKPIRKIIYTTNIMESYHKNLRKVTQNKGTFPNEMAILKLIYLEATGLTQKWSKPMEDWGLTAQQLFIKFGDRMKLDLCVKKN